MKIVNTQYISRAASTSSINQIKESTIIFNKPLSDINFLFKLTVFNWKCKLLHQALISRNHNLWTHAQTFSVSCSDWSLRTLHISLENKSLAVIISAVMFGKINELRYENWFNQKLGDNNVYIRDNSFLSTIVYSNANSTSAALISL